MDTEHFKEKLLLKRQELLAEIGRNQDNARDPVAEVQDPIDQVTSSEAQATSLQLSSNAADTLELVDDALQRIEDGTYGKSIESGEPIPEARLEALPWAEYTVAEQEQHDEEQRLSESNDSDDLLHSAS